MAVVSGARMDVRAPERSPVSLAVGIIPITAPDFYHAFPETAKIVLDSGISTGCVAAVALNLVFNQLGRNREAQEIASVTPA
jgi:xanthine/uracil permease